MKSLILATMLLSTAASYACSELDGTYDLPSMKAQCSTDLGYTPGDDSPLYTIFPKYADNYPRNANGVAGYIEPNHNLVVKAAAGCKTISMTYTSKNSIFHPTENTPHTLIFTVNSYKKGVATITSKEKTPYGCDMGICGKFTETRFLNLSKDNESLLLESVIKTKGVIYAVPYSKTERPLNCRFN